jgi:amino acid adenylation domain-containing protein
MPDDRLHVDRTDGRSLRSGFLKQAASRPEAIALAIGDQLLTYGEIDIRARAAAGAILAAVGRPANRVGVLAYRSETAYTGVLAALFAGAAFVPLNPKFPPARTRAMIGRAELDAIIVERRHVDYLREAAPIDGDGPPVLVADQDRVTGLGQRVLGRSDIEGAAIPPELPPVVPSDVAYLLFTSGSTGVPKGVPITHANVLHFLDVMSARYVLTPQDRLSQTSDQTFDLAVFDVFMAWEAGASVHVLSPIDLVAPTAFVNRHELSVWCSVPSIPALMRRKNILRARTLPTLRWSLFCGEPLPQDTASQWQAAAPNSTVENLYGPTELTVACLAYRWDSATSPAQCVNSIVPIGRPYPGLAAVVVDEDRHSVPNGQPGELLVAGPQTAPGYWRDPSRTSGSFITLTSERGPDSRAVFYATGDRVQRTDTGDYIYLGRADHQIKVLGHRVELGEIEATLRAQPGVVEAVAIGWPMRDGTPQGIAAFVSGEGLSADAVRTAARAHLPAYMTPGRIEIVGDMPLNANGKIDRTALTDRLVDSA